MYIIKNALRNINRSKGRNILICIIILVIVISATIALSIRQAAFSAKEEGLEKLNVTANIVIDRDTIMKNSQKSGNVDKNFFEDMMNNSGTLTLSELEKYSTADSVKDFYYTLSSYVDGSSDLEPIENNGGPTPSGNSQSSSEFTLIGYNSDEAMTDFQNGNKKITSGYIFDEGTSNKVCIISKTLAKYNSLKVGDTIKVKNPDNSKKTVSLKITGIYSSSTSNDDSFQQGPGTDSANQILTSYKALQNINSSLDIDGNVKGTYTFANVSDYEKFEKQAKTLGLSDDYTVESSDINQFEQSLQPLNNLSKYSLYFLIVILVIGIVILIIINIFAIRERKYEIGVLTAMGMKKKKVALQFLTETLAITLFAIIIGTTIGSVTSVPITNSLLNSQSLTNSQSFERNQANPREGENSNSSQIQPPTDQNQSSSDSSNSTSNDKPSYKGSPIKNYISSISSATNFTVVLQILAIGLLLSIFASAIAINYIMRFEPLTILSNRD